MRQNEASPVSVVSRGGNVNRCHAEWVRQRYLARAVSVSEYPGVFHHSPPLYAIVLAAEKIPGGKQYLDDHGIKPNQFKPSKDELPPVPIEGAEDKKDVEDKKEQ